MSNIKRFLEIAKEGGYRPDTEIQEWAGVLGNLTKQGQWGLISTSGDFGTIEFILWDPLVWQAVGKIKKWCSHESRWEDGLCSDCYEDDTRKAVWLEKQHSLVDLIACENTIDAALREILK